MVESLEKIEWTPVSVEESERLTIDSGIYNQNGDSRLQKSPHKLIWSLFIPNEKAFASLIGTIRKAFNNISEDTLKLEERYDIIPDESSAHFDVFAANGHELLDIIEKIFDNADIDMDNLYNECGGRFSLKGFKTRIDTLEADADRLL